ncbi:MAG: hypothetical protein LBR05_04840 [Azoarcus sp.]|nr:hypothetical protein [Azoarcus sp.]
MSRKAILAAAALSMLASGGALAIDYASVGRDAILYDASAPTARKLAIVRAGTPLELVISTPDSLWYKVRDPSGGALSWIQATDLSKQRTVLVTAERAAVRRDPLVSAPIVFEAARDLVLELVSVEPGGWVKVRHADGASGFLRFNEVWGL